MVRRTELVVEVVGGGDLVVLDQVASEAFALSGPVAAVFGLCSGERSMEDIAGELDLSGAVIAEALVELERHGLLEDPPEEAESWSGLLDRRGLLVAGAVLSVPLIVSAVLPATAAAGSKAAGALTPVSGSPFAAGEDADSVAFSGGTPGSPTDPLLIATANGGANTASLFAVDTSGALTPVAGSPYSIDRVPRSVAFSGGSPGNGSDPLLFAVARNAGGIVSVYTVSTTGALTPVSGSPYSTGTNSSPASVAFSGGSPADATDPLLFAIADYNMNEISMFTVDTSGGLTPAAGSPYSTSIEPVSVAFGGGTPGSATNPLLLATANFGAGTVSVFTVSAGGALTQASGSPYTTGSEPTWVAFGSGTSGSATDPLLLAVANAGDNTVSVFTVGTGGALTQVSGSPYTTGSEPTSVAIGTGTPGSATDPLLLATANYNANTVSVFTVSTSGELVQVAGSPFGTGSAPYSVAFGGGTPGNANDPLLLATANYNDGTVSVFTVS